MYICSDSFTEPVDFIFISCLVYACLFTNFFQIQEILLNVLIQEKKKSDVNTIMKQMWHICVGRCTADKICRHLDLIQTTFGRNNNILTNVPSICDLRKLLYVFYVLPISEYRLARFMVMSHVTFYSMISYCDGHMNHLHCSQVNNLRSNMELLKHCMRLMRHLITSA